MKKTKDNSNKLLIFATLTIILAISIQLYLYYTESFKENDIIFNSIEWSEKCDGKNYTIEEKNDFCEDCKSGGDCMWPLDLNITIKGAGKIFNSGGETHCYFVIDNINYYKEKGLYYGIPQDDFFTWNLLNAETSHSIQLCCAIEREMFISKVLALEKEWKEVCKTETSGPRCI